MAPAPGSRDTKPSSPGPPPDPASELLCPVPGTIWLLPVHPHPHPTSQVCSKEEESQKL